MSNSLARRLRSRHSRRPHCVPRDAEGPGAGGGDAKVGKAVPWPGDPRGAPSFGEPLLRGHTGLVLGLLVRENVINWPQGHQWPQGVPWVMTLHSSSRFCQGLLATCMGQPPWGSPAWILVLLLLLCPTGSLNPWDHPGRDAAATQPLPIAPAAGQRTRTPNSAGAPPPRLALGLFSWCQHPRLAWGARLETARPLHQTPPAHELDGFLGLSLTREMSPQA